MEGQGRMKVTLTFALYKGDQLVRRDSVTQDIVKVGKDPKSHLRVDDELASRMHAVIEVASTDDITLIDLGNEPGTVVNGARVNKCKIHPGDQVQIGNTMIVLENAEQASAAVEAAPPAPMMASAPMPAPMAPPPAPAMPPPAGANPFAGGPDPFAPKAANPFGGGAGANPFGGGSDPFAFASPNPFAAAADPFGGGEQQAGEGGFKYVMTKSGPDVNPDEVEMVNVPSLEVMILWGDTVLHVQHLTPPRSVYVGEEEGKNLACDYFIPQEKLGTTRAPIVLAAPGAGVNMVILPKAKGTIELPGQPKMKIEDAIAQGKVQPCAELSGAHQIALMPGAKVRMELDNLIFQVATVNAGRKSSAGLFASRDWTTGLYIGLSLLVHTGLLAAMAFFMPPLGLTDDEGVSKDQLFLIQQYLNAAAEREMEQKETEQVAEDRPDNKEGGTGTRAKGEEGSMGNPNSRDANKRYGVAGPKDNQDAHIARSAALREAAEFGMIGLLNTGAGGDPNAPTAPWGRDDSLGTDPISARGNMWGDSIGDAFGAGGLGLSGIGEGGGGRGEGIGLGSIGTLGHGAGTGTGQGFGSGHGRLGGSHRTKPPQVRMGATTVNGRLPPEVIQRIVRQNYGRFRLCYENGLRNNPNLQGRVAVRFVIGRDGSVSNVGNGGSDLPDPAVVQCVIRAYYGLSFPQPEGGIVTVVYPIMFSPGG
jgi:pSer/pThr/pTyr-binding forkhead associated (FHA) protein